MMQKVVARMRSRNGTSSRAYEPLSISVPSHVLEDVELVTPALLPVE